MADKDYPAIAELILPRAKAVITVAPDCPRALPPKALADLLVARGLTAVTAKDKIEDAVKYAREITGEADVICAFGSLYLAGAIRSLFPVR